MLVLKRRRLASDDEGAIMVAGIFVTAFLVGALYMLIGASTAMQHGELMQDGADSAAFSAAQTHAKGMNLIALSNMVKVSALANMVALSSIPLGAQDAINWIDSGTKRKARYGHNKPFLRLVQARAIVAFARSQASLAGLISAADDAQNALIDDLPLIAEAVVNQQFQPAYSPPITTFFLSPVRSLPVEAEAITTMCARMYPYALGITRNAFKLVPDGTIRRLAITFSQVYFVPFCLSFGSPAMIPNALPGTEEYQVRAFAGGGPLSTTGEKGVQVATWGRTPEVSQISLMRDRLSRISFAQAEYYHSGPTAEDFALWSMNWEARLRRFRWPGGSLTSDCLRRRGPTQACAVLPQLLNQMEWATVH